jgi:hypothetical protein
VRIHSAFRTYDGASKIRPEKGVKIFKEEDRRVGVFVVRSAYICDPDNNVIEFIDLVRAPVERAYGSKQDPSQAPRKVRDGSKPESLLGARASGYTRCRHWWGERSVGARASGAGSRQPSAEHFFSNALSFCRSAIAVLVRSP